MKKGLIFPWYFSGMIPFFLVGVVINHEIRIPFLNNQDSTESKAPRCFFLRLTWSSKKSDESKMIRGQQLATNIAGWKMDPLKMYHPEI